ncbi:nicotinate-nucleotide pyrophosphorylase [carboxylating]-like isoform X1 [Gigantopelta aegis]|uniref:nicotinate-nucleotide pyrophosphorylase [carboxylating]-like isoform X1 n=1 Tax=Gigantopelta aegis TaxID=1735272 RepID=UPI001B88E6E3|nr:nicotinate-nucleotide pyrophosphorylase [carboxylating]-like isoform X1 [Gigantopelta aegis]
MTTQKNKCDSILSGIYSNRYSHILTPTNLKHLAREWLKEDTPSFDYAGFVVGEKEETAVLLVKSPGVVAGRPFFDAIFEELDCKVEWDCEEGEHIENVRTVAKVTGKVRHLLLGERVALNCLARASGIATYARKLKRIVEGVEWKGEVAGTRKTTPGFRMVEKYALLVGGVATHRHDLSSMVMLKDNHIWTAGNVAQAVKDVRVVAGFSTKIEVECRSIEDATDAATAGAEVVMLDNFSPEAAVKSAAILKEQFPRLIIEASGGITESTITKYCDKNVDVISVSKLVQGYDIVDFSMKITKAGRDPHNPTVHI